MQDYAVEFEGAARMLEKRLLDEEMMHTFMKDLPVKLQQAHMFGGMTNWTTYKESKKQVQYPPILFSLPVCGEVLDGALFPERAAFCSACPSHIFLVPCLFDFPSGRMYRIVAVGGAIRKQQRADGGTGGATGLGGEDQGVREAAGDGTGGLGGFGEGREGEGRGHVGGGEDRGREMTGEEAPRDQTGQQLEQLQGPDRATASAAVGTSQTYRPCRHLLPHPRPHLPRCWADYDDGSCGCLYSGSTAGGERTTEQSTPTQIGVAAARQPPEGSGRGRGLGVGGRAPWWRRARGRVEGGGRAPSGKRAVGADVGRGGRPGPRRAVGAGASRVRATGPRGGNGRGREPGAGGRAPLGAAGSRRGRGPEPGGRAPRGRRAWARAGGGGPGTIQGRATGPLRSRGRGRGPEAGGRAPRGRCLWARARPGGGRPGPIGAAAAGAGAGRGRETTGAGGHAGGCPTH
ncbi:unnamed protein product [Closterium sp. NIES-64]|nr:unnamed protein product [Closterium sp. NIES-64]